MTKPKKEDAMQKVKEDGMETCSGGVNGPIYNLGDHPKIAWVKSDACPRCPLCLAIYRANLRWEKWREAEVELLKLRGTGPTA